MYLKIKFFSVLLNSKRSIGRMDSPEEKTSGLFIVKKNYSNFEE